MQRLFCGAFAICFVFYSALPCFQLPVGLRQACSQPAIGALHHRTSRDHSGISRLRWPAVLSASSNGTWRRPSHSTSGLAFAAGVSAFLTVLSLLRSRSRSASDGSTSLAAKRKKLKGLAEEGESTMVRGKNQQARGKYDARVELARRKEKEEAKRKRKKIYSIEEELEVGVIAPLGFWDPLEMLKKGGKGSTTLRKMRDAETKHGRVAMVALVGAVVQHYIRVPGFEKEPMGLAALSTYKGQIFLALVIGICFIAEIYILYDREDLAPGDFEDPWGVAGKDGPDREMRNKELSNGRLAMIGIFLAGLNQKISGLDVVDQLSQPFKQFN
eukprot:TRINITY_DN51519_c0_g1_i1.p1 TRINITY_DN51519_c0_g1~~TRINITY_DN51519_c0_g1_i1.p1  ORF type:complete len:329 (+),score=42.81 TRINITY_DN51519_c0_g1_i1:50-1036(+)